MFGSPLDDDSMSKMVSMARLVSSPMALKCLSTPVSGKLPMNTPGVGSGTTFLPALVGSKTGRRQRGEFVTGETTGEIGS